MSAGPLEIRSADDGATIGAFRAMASPWEVHVAGANPEELRSVTAAVAAEVLRIECKYSRYREDSVLQALNRAQGVLQEVDEETAGLLNYAQELWHSSEGRFDITTGVLRRAWSFDGSDRLPSAEQVQALLQWVGWQRVEWQASQLRLPAGMELDFGGIGKEYAVDRALSLACAQTSKPVLINGGGDLAASAAPAPGESWRIGIEAAPGKTAPLVKLRRGAIATSGDARRFLLKDGVRYSHVLDPRNGWPVRQAPSSVSVLAKTCTEAGSHATLALLHGAAAEAWLGEAGVEYWMQW